MLDVCPVSNVRTGVVASLAEHPLPGAGRGRRRAARCPPTTRPCSAPTWTAEYQAVRQLGVSAAGLLPGGRRGRAVRCGHPRDCSGDDLAAGPRLAGGDQTAAPGRSLVTGRGGDGPRPVTGRPPPVVAIVGGGVAGLAAAFAAARRGPGRDRAGGLAAARAASWPSRAVGGVEVDAGAEALLARPPGGRRPDRRAGPGRRAAPAGHHLGRHLDPRRGPAAAPAAVHGRARRPRRAGRHRPAVARRAGPGPARTPSCPPTPRDAGDASVTERVGAADGPGAGGPRGRAAAGRGLRRPLRGPVVPGHAGPAGRGRPRFRSLSEAAASLLPPAPPAPRPAPAGQPAAPPPVFTTLAAGSAPAAAAGRRVGRRGPDPGHRARADPDRRTAGG